MPAAAPPTIADVVARLNAILLGDAPRGDVAEWAAGWIGASPPAISDPALWQLLRLAASVDLRSPSRAGGQGTFLHAEADIRDWIDGAGA
jgi:hypothetical protein